MHTYMHACTRPYMYAANDIYDGQRLRVRASVRVRVRVIVMVMVRVRVVVMVMVRVRVRFSSLHTYYSLLMIAHPNSGELLTVDCQLDSHSWTVATYCSLLTTRYPILYYTLHSTYYTLHTTHSLLSTRYSLLATHCSLLTTHYSPLTTQYSLLTTHYSPLTTHFLLLTTHYYLLLTATYCLLLTVTTYHCTQVPRFVGSINTLMSKPPSAWEASIPEAGSSRNRQLTTLPHGEQLQLSHGRHLQTDRPHGEQLLLSHGRHLQDNIGVLSAFDKLLPDIELMEGMLIMREWLVAMQVVSSWSSVVGSQLPVVSSQ